MQGVLVRRVAEAEWSVDDDAHVHLVDPTKGTSVRLAPWTRDVLEASDGASVEGLVAHARRGPSPPTEHAVRRFILALEKIGLARIEVPAPAVIAGRAVVRELGRGAAGVAYLVEDMGSPLVAKLPWDFLHPMEDVVEALRHEANVLARLDHPGIVRGRGLVEHDGRPALLRAFVEGAPLRAARAGLVEETADVLAHAHARGLVLVDLKPSNFLAGARVTLIDVGHAREAGRAVGRGRGTPGFIAPEVAAGAPADVRSDLWSWGAMLRALGVPVPPSLVEIDPARRPGSVADARALSGWP